MSASMRGSLNEIADPGNLDSAVGEVFQTMLSTVCQRDAGALPDEPEWLTAVVGFGGLLSGACVLRCGGKTACALAQRMIGTPFAAADETVKDAAGEICNMLAGTWKGMVPELAAGCALSVPAVITGRDYRLHVQAPEFRLQHGYEFDGLRFEVTILCDGLK